VTDGKKNGRILFDRPKPTAGYSASGRRRIRRRRRRRRRRSVYCCISYPVGKFSLFCVV
jgi:hypothetical protein